MNSTLVAKLKIWFQFNFLEPPNLTQHSQFHPIFPKSFLVNGVSKLKEAEILPTQ